MIRGRFHETKTGAVLGSIFGVAALGTAFALFAAMTAIPSDAKGTGSICKHQPYNIGRAMRRNLLTTLAPEPGTGENVRVARKQIESPRKGDYYVRPRTDLLLSLARWCTFAAGDGRLRATRECADLKGSYMLYPLGLGVHCNRGDCTLLSRRNLRAGGYCRHAFFLPPIFRQSGYYRNNRGYRGPMPRNPSNPLSPEVFILKSWHDPIVLFMKLTNLGPFQQQGRGVMFSRVGREQTHDFYVRVLPGGLIREVSDARMRRLYYYNERRFRKVARDMLTQPRLERDVVLIHDPWGRREVVRLMKRRPGR